MRPGKRHSFYNLLAALVRHQPVEAALKAAAGEFRFFRRGLGEEASPTDASPGDASPGEALVVALADMTNPVERAVLENASSRAELASRLADLAAVAETERAGQRAFFNHTLFPLIIGLLYFYIIGSLGVVFFLVMRWESIVRSTYWGASGTSVEIPLFLFGIRIAFMMLLLALPVVFFLLRYWRVTWLSWIPGTEKIYRSARGAWASHMLAVQLKAGIDRGDAVTNAEKTLGCSLGQDRKTDPLLRRLLAKTETPAGEFERLHRLLFRRLVNSRAHRLAWVAPAFFWCVVAYGFTCAAGFSIVDWLFWF